MEIYFASNLKLLRRRRKKTQDEVAFATEIKRPTLSGYENSGVLPSIEALLSLSGYFNISVDSLLKVDLHKLSEFQLSEIERGNDVFIRGAQIRILATTVNTKNKENIELVPEKAKAGYALGYSDPGFISDLPRYQLPFLSQNKKYRTFQITGDSMLPIREGSWVTGEFVQDWYNIQSGKPYIILTLDDGIVFKIVDNLIQDEGRLRLYSLNSYYEPYDVSVNDIKEVWLFAHFISSEMPDSNNSGEDLTQKIFELSREVDAIKRQINKKSI